MTPKIDAIDLQFDEAEISSYGLEILSAKARLVQRSYRVDNHGAELHISLQGIYDPELKLDKPSEYESLSLLVEMLEHPNGSVPSLAVPERLFDLDKRSRVEMVEQISMGYSLRPLNPQSMTFRLRCAESAQGNDDRFEPAGSPLTKFRPEVLGAVRACGCELKFQIANAGLFVYDTDDDPGQYDASYYLSGCYSPCKKGSEKPKRHTPFDTIMTTFIDKHGFYLYKKSHSLDLDRIPTRRMFVNWATVRQRVITICRGVLPGSSFGAKARITMPEELHVKARRLQGQLLSEFAAAPGLFKELAGIESLISETYLNRVQYELLQNSDDAGATEVEIRLAQDGTATWKNNGRTLTSEDLESLCRSAVSTKTRGDAIGYRGIGFKSVAAVCKRVDIRSGNVFFVFSREETQMLLNQCGFDSHTNIPMIRIPTLVAETNPVEGVSFAMHGCGVRLDVDPLSLLFLRNVRQLTQVDKAGNISNVRLQKNGRRASLHVNGAVAEFELRQGRRSVVGIPLNDCALSLVRSKGMLACFLPLRDEIGLPIIVSGDLLTDPSRSHAVLEDSTTMEVLQDSAELLSEILGASSDDLHQLAWNLLMGAEDPRAYLMGETNNSVSAFWAVLVKESKRSVSSKIRTVPLQLTPDDAALLAIANVPAALALSDNRIQARALKSIFRLQEVSLPQIYSKDTLDRLHPATKDRLRELIKSDVQLTGRSLTKAEQSLVEEQQQQPISAPPAAPQVTHHSNDSVVARGLSIHEVLRKWRAVEVAVKEFLNTQGWQLSDVSAQNLGYDLMGLDDQGAQALVEVKSLQRVGDPLSLTNNEMSTMHTANEAYWAALVIDNGGSTQLAMVDLKSAGLSFDKVCRRWDWESTDWRAKAVILGDS